MATVFNVTMNAENMEGKGVLVFLRPNAMPNDALVHAWQVLIPSAGSMASFEYDPVISANVFSRRNPPHYILSDTNEVQPGSLLEALSTEGVSPKLQVAPTTLAEEHLSPTQVGVINHTHPHVELDCNWLVSGSLVVTIPNLGDGETCLFELEANLYFIVDRPPLVGETYSTQHFSDMTCYPVPAADSEIYVNVIEDQGRWQFTFSERV